MAPGTISLPNSLPNLQLGELLAAEQSAEEASRQDPGRHMLEIYHLLGLIHARKQEYATAAPYLRRYLKHLAESTQVQTVKRQLEQRSKR